QAPWDAWEERYLAGRRTTLSYRERVDGNPDAAVALHRREQRRRSAGFVPDRPPSTVPNEVPPPCDITVPSRRVPDTVRAILYAPGTWSPERLRTAGLSCRCSACQEEWPDVDAWWHAHNVAVQGSVTECRPRRNQGRRARRNNPRSPSTDLQRAPIGADAHQ